MAKNMWGKQPVKKDDTVVEIQPSFWNSEFVEGQFKYEPEPYEFGTARGWEPGEQSEGIDPNRVHDSWVKRFEKRGNHEASEGDDDLRDSTTPENAGLGSQDLSSSQVGGAGAAPPPSSNVAESAGLGPTEGMSKTMENDGIDIEAAHDTWVKRFEKRGNHEASTGTELGLKGDPLKAFELRGDHQASVGTELGLKGEALERFELRGDHQASEGSDLGLSGEAQERSELRGNHLPPEAQAAMRNFTPPSYAGIDPDTNPDTWVKSFEKRGDVAPPSGGGQKRPGDFKRSGTSVKSKLPDYSGIDDRVGSWNFECVIPAGKGSAIKTENAGLLSISGISMETENIEFKFGMDPFVRTMPGKAKFGDVELTRIYKVNSNEFYEWRNNISKGKDDFRTVTVNLFHIDYPGKNGSPDKKKPVLSLTLHDCYPSKWECPDF